MGAAMLMRVWLAIFGVVLPIAAIMAITTFTALNTQLQGILLTIEALRFSIFVMMLMPKACGDDLALKSTDIAATI